MRGTASGNPGYRAGLSAVLRREPASEGGSRRTRFLKGPPQGSVVLTGASAGAYAVTLTGAPRRAGPAALAEGLATGASAPRARHFQSRAWLSLSRPAGRGLVHAWSTHGRHMCAHVAVLACTSQLV